jgi:hypothetical protein
MILLPFSKLGVIGEVLAEGDEEYDVAEKKGNKGEDHK